MIKSFFFLELILTSYLLTIFMIYIIIYLLNKPFNLTFNPPKAHAFLKKDLKSAISDIIIGIVPISVSPFIYNIVLSSAHLFAAGLYFNMFSPSIRHLLIPVLINILEFIIQNTLDLYTYAWEFLDNPDNNFAMLQEVHAYLTPYLRSYESIFHFVQRVVTYLDGVNSDHLARVEGLARQFRDAGDLLLEVYRTIEGELLINIHQSPISPREWE